MQAQGMARWMAMAGRASVAASLFFVLVWWRASVYLFAAGWIVFGLAWLISDTKHALASGAQGARRLEELG